MSIIDDVTVTLPKAPITQKDTRVITKHFLNCFYHMDRNIHAFFGFLIYESNRDNEIKFNARHLLRYSASIAAANQFYGCECKLKKSYIVIRKYWTYLTNNGYIIRYKDTFYINPMFTYRQEYITKGGYDNFCQAHQKGDIDSCMEVWFKMINEKLHKDNERKSLYKKSR